jgi:putative transposon-encoded protein
MMVKKRIQLEGYEVAEKVVKPIGNSAYAAAPKRWIGKKVALVLLEPTED